MNIDNLNNCQREAVLYNSGPLKHLISQSLLYVKNTLEFDLGKFVKISKCC